MPIGPKCHSDTCCKDGFVKTKQRFKCKACGYRHTVNHRGLSLEIRRQALQLYLAGFGFRSIGRLLKCSHVTVSQWINSHGDSIKAIRADVQTNVIKTQDVYTPISARQAISLVVDIKTDCIALCILVTPRHHKANSQDYTK